MMWVKIKYENKFRKILSVYDDREQAIKEWAIGDNIFPVDDIEEYKRQTNEWNESIHRMQSGIKFKAKEETEKKDWDYDSISEAGKVAINTAISNSIDAHWMLVMRLYIEEGWAKDNFCCSVQLPQFKEKIYEMLSNNKK